MSILYPIYIFDSGRALRGLGLVPSRGVGIICEGTSVSKRTRNSALGDSRLCGLLSISNLSLPSCPRFTISCYEQLGLNFTGCFKVESGYTIVAFGSNSGTVVGKLTDRDGNFNAITVGNVLRGGCNGSFLTYYHSDILPFCLGGKFGGLCGTKC